MGEGRPHDLGLRLAGELDVVRIDLEGLAALLCAEPVMIARYGAEIQQFDRLAQTVDEVASLLRARGAGGDPIGAVRLEAMADRLAGSRW